MPATVINNLCLAGSALWTILALCALSAVCVLWTIFFFFFLLLLFRILLLLLQVLLLYETSEGVQQELIQMNNHKTR